ncbi:MAG: type II secretion system F family protein [Planctomycetota bacterium]|nr:MAG: type II secretion system F family protein [Planctomycetota bacterium]
MDFASIIFLFVIAVGLIAYSVFPRKGEKRDALKRRLEGKRRVDETEEIRQKAQQQTAAQRLAKRATPVLSKIIMPVSADESSQLRMKLTQAGYRHPSAQTLFLGMKTAAMAVFLVAGAITGTALGYSTVNVLCLCLFAGGVGFIAPGLWLSMAISKRQQKIRHGLPDILDLLVVSVESGLALDAALKRVGEEMAIVHPEVSEEFRIAIAESQMGIPRSEALENMANRVGVDELRSMTSVITQAERFGTSIAKALRNQGDAMRTKRRQQAEERAQKTAVKLMIPLVVFIFPAMGIVLAGPAAINVMEAFSN